MNFFPEKRELTADDHHVSTLSVPHRPETHKVGLYLAGCLVNEMAIRRHALYMVEESDPRPDTVTYKFHAPLGVGPVADQKLLEIQYDLRDLWTMALRRMIIVDLPQQYDVALTIHWPPGHPIRPE